MVAENKTEDMKPSEQMMEKGMCILKRDHNK